MRNIQIILCPSKWIKKFFLNLFLFFFITTFFSLAQENSKKSRTDSLNYSWERFSVNLGGFITGMNSDIALGVEQLGLGITINLEDALGLKTSMLALRGEAGYVFGKRKRSTFRFHYFGLFRNSSKVLESDIEIGDNIFPIGTEVNSRLNISNFKVNYDFNFYMDKRVKLGFTVGLFIMPINFSLTAMGFSEGSAYFVAPLPVLGIQSNFAITPKIFLRQNIQILYLEISNFKGNILDFNARIEYNVWKHIGFGLGINSHRMSISGVKDGENLLDFDGSLKTGYTGLLFFAKYYF
ncbi:MAG: hypothetical protein QNK30_13810 [Bacteroidales bacterium]|nr:hypothetical protein [Bacteroidales bacterium]